MDNLKMFKGRREARRKCAYLQTVIDEGNIFLNISDARMIYKLWREVDALNVVKQKREGSFEKSYNFFDYLIIFYNNFSKENIKDNESIEKEIAYICYVLGM